MPRTKKQPSPAPVPPPTRDAVRRAAEAGVVMWGSCVEGRSAYLCVRGWRRRPDGWYIDGENGAEYRRSDALDLQYARDFAPLEHWLASMMDEATRTRMREYKPPVDHRLVEFGDDDEDPSIN